MKSQHFLGLKIVLQKDYDSLINKLREAESSEREALEYLHAIEANEFKIVPALKHNGHSSDILKKINAFQETMANLIRTAQETRWHDAGITKFNEIITHSFHKQQELFDRIVSELARYLKVNQVALFTISEDRDADTVIKLEACYAYERKKFVQRQFALGEGLVGQAILEKQSIFLTNVPSDYIKITSGLGGATPDCILITPLLDDHNVVGALELASFRKLSKTEINFVESLSRTITASVHNMRQNQQLKKLFDRSEVAQLQIREKEEELRQQMEELQANNEELSRKSSELERLGAELERKNQQIIDIQKHERELLESKLEAQRRSYELIIDQLKNKLLNNK